MPGGGVGDRAVGNVNDDQGCGGEEEPRPLEQDTGHLAEHVRDRDPGVEQCRDHSTQERHVGCCGESVAGDVADDESQSVIIGGALRTSRPDRHRVAGREVPAELLPAMTGRAPNKLAEARR